MMILLRTKAGETEDENDADESGGDTGEDNKSDDFDYQARARKEYEKNGTPFLTEVLPKLPKLRNGMKILGVCERSPLVDSGEVFKLRMFRPDKPVRTSEVFDDGATIRFTNLSRLVSDDFIISKFKVELATFKVGLADDDMIGLKAAQGVFEADDFSTLTVKPFVERKLRGKSKLYHL